MVDIRLGDCLELMKDIPDGSVDLVLTDPPYGTTACKWDSVIPFKPMWEQLNRIIKPNGIIALFANQPFTSALISSNIANYKYNWVWLKNRGTGFQYAKSQPMRQIEDVCIFNKTLNDTVANNSVFDDIKAYFYEQRELSGLRLCDFTKLLGNKMAGHYFTKGIQWSLPTEKDYQKLQATGFFCKPYSELKSMYDTAKASIETSKVIYNPQMIKLDKPVKYKKASSCNTIGGIENKKNIIGLMKHIQQMYWSLQRYQNRHTQRKSLLTCLNILSAHIQMRVKRCLTSQWVAAQQALLALIPTATLSALNLMRDIST